ncbi:MAG: hypothetical protein J5544_02730 [Clostridia bacterium]|nr:hypothetical protein [Clostridia bacterium]
MNSKEYLSSLGDIDSELIESAANMKAAPRRSYGWIAAAAAAAIMVIGGALLIGRSKPKGEKTAVLSPSNSPSTVSTVTVSPVTDAPATEQPTLPTAADPFLPAGVRDRFDGHTDTSIINEGLGIGDYFILNGRVYQAYMRFLPYAQPEVFALIGPKVADVSVHWGMDEPTAIGEEESGPEFTSDTTFGKYTAAVYELRGCDPQKLLCLFRDGELCVFFSGAGAVAGADLFEGGFGLREHISSLLYEAYVRGNEEFDEKTRSLDPQDYPEIGRFIDAIDSAEWIENPHRNPSDPVSASFELHLMLNDGMRVELLLYSNGRVFFRDCFTEAMLRPDREAVDALIEVLMRHEGELTVLPEKDLEGQVNYLRSLGGIGALLPASLPDGYEFKDMVYADYLLDGSGLPVGYSKIWVPCKCIIENEYVRLGYNVYERSAYEASPWYAQYDDLSVNRLDPVPIGEFTREKILDCVLNKEGAEHSIYAAVDMGEYVVIVYCSYIVDDEIGSQFGLDQVIDTIYTMIVSAAG